MTEATENKVEVKDKVEVTSYHPADTNGDGVVSDKEHEMYLEFKKKELEDQDAQRDVKRKLDALHEDAMRKMTWFALAGLLLYPFLILVTSVFGADKAAEIIGDIAPTYFVAIAGLVAAFFGADALKGKKK